MEGSEASEYPAGGAEPEVGSRHRLPIAVEGDTTGLRGDAIAAQRGQLSSSEFFQSRSTDCEET
jgi:hypothetical protein